MKTTFGSLSALAAAAVLAVVAAPAAQATRGAHEPVTTATTQDARSYVPYAILPNGLPAGVVRDISASPAAQVDDVQDVELYVPYAILPNGVPAGIVRGPSASPAATPVVRVVEPGGFHWTDALIGAAVGAGAIAAAALATLYGTRQHHRGTPARA